MSRPKGSVNKSTSDLHTLCKRKGISPFSMLLNIIALDWKALGHKAETRVMYTKGGPVEVNVITADMQLRAIIEACQYLHSKRRSIEVQDTTPEIPRPLKNMSDEDLDDL